MALLEGDRMVTPEDDMMALMSPPAAAAAAGGVASERGRGRGGVTRREGFQSGG